MVREIKVYENRRGTIVLRPYSKTTNRLWIGWGDCRVGKRDDISEFGTIIAELLLLSLHDVPPPQFGMLDREPGAVKLAELLGVKKELGRNVRILSIEDDGSDITFTPTRNEGRGGFVRMESVRSMVPHESPAAFIGSAAISALDSAEFFSEESS